MAEERGLITYESRDGQEIKLSFDTVRKYLVSGKPEFVTDQEIVLYMGTCKARGLNPFKRDCYLVKYTQGDPAATIVSIDYFRSRAKAQDDCVGWQSGIILQGNDGELEYRKGSLMLDGEHLVGGWFKAKPKNWDEEYEWTIPLRPYVKKTAEGRATRFWSEDNQPYMIAKVVESQGLRRLWPDEFQGVFIEDEIEPRDITPPENPLKIPQPIKEKADVVQTRTDHGGGPAGDGPEGVVKAPAQGAPPDETKREAQPRGKAKAEAPKAEPKKEPPTKQNLIDWLENKATPEELMNEQRGENANYFVANYQRANLSAKEMSDCFGVWNRRRDEVSAEGPREREAGEEG